MELKQLRSFIAVAQSLNFSRAARTLHLSQPALSAQIKALEDDVGTQLLERNRRTVRLTRAGESLLSDARLLLENASDAQKRALRIATGGAGHLRVAFVASATLELVPAVVLAFRARYPRVTMELKNLNTTAQLEALEARSIDIGFVRLPLSVPRLTVERVHSEPFAIAVSKSHPLAKEKQLHVAQLANEPFVTYGQRWAPEFYQTWTGLCRKAGFTPVILQETAEMDTALALVAAGMGVSILPLGVVNRHRRVLRVQPLLSEAARSELGIAVLADNHDPLRENMIAIARGLSMVDRHHDR